MTVKASQKILKYQKLPKQSIKKLRLIALIESTILRLFGTAGTWLLFWLSWFRLALAFTVFIFVFATAYYFVFPKFRRMRYRYYIGNDRVEIIEGVIFVRRKVISIEHLQKITVNRSFFDNRYGVAKVCLVSDKKTVKCRFIESDKAEEIALYLKTVLYDSIDSEKREGQMCIVH